MPEILNYIKENKEALTIIISTIIGIIALATFFKAIMEFRLQGRQKRAELYDKFDNELDEPNIKNIVDLLERNEKAIAKVPMIDRYYFLGLYEKLAMAVNSKLISKEIAFYMFGKFALDCWDNKNFWIDIDKNSYDWDVFRHFVKDMKSFDYERAHRSKLASWWYERFFHKRFRH